MLVRVRLIQDRIRNSLFFVPLLFIVGAVILGEVALEVDARVDDLPDRLTATVESSRQVLTLVAGATLSFAGVAFSVSLLLISLASSQFSPRVAHGLFRDPFNKRVMGLVVGTFTYCLFVLRSVRGPLEEGGTAVVPSISTLLAVVLGLVSVLAIVAFISHSAHSMDVSQILHQATDEALEQLREFDVPLDEEGDDALEIPGEQGLVVAYDDHGWVQQINYAALLQSVDPATVIRLDTSPGTYAVKGTRICTIWPAPRDSERASHAVRDAITLGESRTMHQDVSFGVRQLADVALKALSPGINDPTTAQDALYHLSTVVREIIIQNPEPKRLSGPERRVLILSRHMRPEDTIGLAFDEARIAAKGAPTVQIYLLENFKLLIDSLDAEKHQEVIDALKRQASLTLEMSQNADLPRDDIERVRSAYERYFVS